VSRWLFLFAHPDDEIAIAAQMRRLSLDGDDVFAYWAHSTPVRKLESSAVALRLGIEAHFDAFPDGSLPEHLDSLRNSIDQLMQRHRPDHVATLAFEQGHRDHDALNWAVRTLWQGDLTEIPIYRPARPGPAVQRLWNDNADRCEIRLSQEERELKLSLLDAYPSQRLGRILRVYRALDQFRFGESPLLTREIWRVQPPLDYRTPNVPPHLLRRIERTDSWRRWIQNLDRYENWNSGEAKISLATAAPT